MRFSKLFCPILASFLFANLASCSEYKNNFEKGTEMTQNISSEQWSIDYARKMMDESVHVSNGIEDIDKFNKIIEQKNLGDANALYVYSYMLLYYDIAQTLNISDETAKLEAIKILSNLASKEQPQACYLLATINTDKEGRDYLEKTLNLNESELLSKRIDWLRIAVKHEEPANEWLADTLLFGLNAGNGSSFLLPDSPAIKEDSISTKEAINSYMLCATKEQSEYCAARMAEAYYWGYGVEKNYTQAYAWSKLVSEKKQSSMVYVNINKMNEIKEKTQRTFDQKELELAEKAFNELK